MKISTYYFSGTGNTAWVVRRLAERLTDLGNEVTATSCEQTAASAVDLTACDVIGIAFPIHSSLVPPIFRDFLRGLPPGAGKPLFAVTTAGYWAGDMAWYGVKPLKDKGYEPFLLGNVVVANNLHLPLLSPLPVTSPEKMPRKLEKASRKVNKLADLIHQRKPHVEGIDPFGRLLGIVQRCVAERFESLAFKGFFADGGCTQCGWCVRHCPVHNIEMADGGVKFLGNCILCMRCYSFCPAQAIQATEKTKNVKKYRRYRGPEGRPYTTTDWEISGKKR